MTMADLLEARAISTDGLDDPEDFACECDDCGELVYNTKDLFIARGLNGKVIRLCMDCVETVALEDLLTKLGVEWDCGEAESINRKAKRWEARA